jgi:DNA-binding response OmpR family regulator
MSPDAPLRSVLHIDDDAEIREVVAIALRRLGGIEVRSAASGREGIACAQRDPPDLILLDFMMPDMDGLSVLARLKDDEGVRHIPVAFLTAHADAAVRSRMRDLGALDVVDKPFRASELVARLGATWRRHLAQAG